MAKRPKMVRDPGLAQALRSALERGSLAPAQASRVIRALDGLSQQEFADRIGLHVKVLRSIESGRGNPSYDSMAKIAAAAGLRLAFVGHPHAVQLLDPGERMEDERLRRQADAKALASGRVSGRQMHERNALRVDEFSFELPRLA